MENLNERNNDAEKNIITVDLEHLYHTGAEHPSQDDGEVVMYKIKVDDHYHYLQHRHRTGEQILALESKSPKDFKLEQCWKAEDGQTVCMHILADVSVDFKAPGIERFITKSIVHEYDFFIGKMIYHTQSSRLTVRQILEDFAKVNPIQKSLGIKTETGVHEYTDLNESVSLEGCPHFTLFDNQPVGVS